MLSVTTSSEPLSLDSRARIAEPFGVGVGDQFGSTEGLIGNSPPDDPTSLSPPEQLASRCTAATRRPRYLSPARELSSIVSDGHPQRFR